MSDNGYKVPPEAFDNFGKALDELADHLREAGSMIGSCVADPGIFGAVGQLFGAGASLHCGKARDQLTSYAESFGKFRENLDQGKKTYQEQENHVVETLAKYQA